MTFTLHLILFLVLSGSCKVSPCNETSQLVEQILTVQREQVVVLEEIRNTIAKLFTSIRPGSKDDGPYKYNVSEIPYQKTGETKFCGDDFDLASSTFPTKPLICDQGWITIQRRGTPTEGGKGRTDFERNFTDYTNGFGLHLNGEDFWIGLQTIHELTKAGYTQLRVDFEDWVGMKAYTTYSEFNVGGAQDKYNLTVGGYKGTAANFLHRNSGKKFTTFDSDNDEFDNNNCGSQRHGGWWYWNCNESHLNSRYHNSSREEKPYKGIIWYPWRAYDHSLKKVEMKIRKPHRII
ncbi:Fibrinogen C domain-containing protein 1-A [Folsomia candida]|uniref:Fibrinogen C domain-containing protein 1-A n=1 Tax=Folsomia candida TaxID=158441 RepID=A0A226DYP0_FOLCA|nr:Fibrinogen C domain-containing protein 1-A [Folsomia candida]